MVTTDSIKERVPLGRLTTFGIGGVARYYLRAATAGEVAWGAEWASARNLPLLVLGGGSNLLVADEGFPGLALHISITGTNAVESVDGVDLSAGAGESWDAIVERAVRSGWSGIECLSGIPGCVGATPIQNVGAYGQDVSETIVRVRALDLSTGVVVEFSNPECSFGYRDSRFKRGDRGRYIVLDVTYRLRNGAPPSVRYPELERYLASRGIDAPTLVETRDAVLAIRRRKSMVVDPTDPDARSAGSFFVNPVIPADTLSAVERVAADLLGPDAVVPRFPATDGHVKVPAAWLIERAGFQKGYRKGAVGLSSKHTLAIVNAGGGTAADVVALAREIHQRVWDIFGVALTPEPVFVNLSFDV